MKCVYGGSRVQNYPAANRSPPVPKSIADRMLITFILHGALESRAEVGYSIEKGSRLLFPGEGKFITEYEKALRTYYHLMGSADHALAALLYLCLGWHKEAETALKNAELKNEYGQNDGYSEKVNKGAVGMGLKEIIQAMGQRKPVHVQ